MERYVGRLVQSKAGHDAGYIYIVLRGEGGFVWLADGKLRPVEKPKRKNIKHITRLSYETGDTGQNIGRGMQPKDEEIRRLIKQYRKDKQSAQSAQSSEEE